jgi:hypothetical protein
VRKREGDRVRESRERQTNGIAAIQRQLLDADKRSR